MTIPTSIVSKPTLDIAHHRIHEGNHFTVHKISTVTLGTPKYFLIIPPPSPPGGSIIEIHLIFHIDSDVGGTLEFFENPDIAGNGTQLNIINNNRRSTTTSQAQVFEDPNVTSDGPSILFQQRKGSVAISDVVLGGFDRDDDEFILHQNTNYILKFTPLANANITTELNWYDNRPSSPVPIP